MIKAYILIRTHVGMVNKVKDSLKKVQGIVNVDDVSGPVDIIAIAEAESLRSLRKLIVERIHRIEGIYRTETAIVL